MNYSKPAITIQDQIAKLKGRGLRFEDEALAESYLSNISYYRLRAYTYPFQDNDDPDHPFTTDITFEEIIKLYVFDRKLRILVFDALEKIEISFRTQIIYNYAIMHGSHWHVDKTLYRNNNGFNYVLKKIRQEVDRCNETFIEHYNNNYTAPNDPPAWMSLEVVSFGLLSLLFANLSVSSEKTIVTRYYGLKSIKILDNWIHSFSHIRNICCHHGRLWNRVHKNSIIIPKRPLNDFVNNKSFPNNKLYGVLCAIEYVLRIISPKSTIKSKLINLIDNIPLGHEGSMGFPPDWREEEFWKDDRVAQNILINTEEE